MNLGTSIFPVFPLPRNDILNETTLLKNGKLATSGHIEVSSLMSKDPGRELGHEFLTHALAMIGAYALRRRREQTPPPHMGNAQSTRS